MKELNARQLKAIQEIAINAGTVVLGTMILGWSISPGTFNWISVAGGFIIYASLIGLTLWVNREREGK